MTLWLEMNQDIPHHTVSSFKIGKSIMESDTISTLAFPPQRRHNSTLWKKIVIKLRQRQRAAFYCDSSSLSQNLSVEIEHDCMNE